MHLNVIIAAILMVATTGIHAGGMMLALSTVERQRGDLKQRLRRTRIYWISGIVLLMFLVSLVEVLLWAVTYLALDAIQGYEQALYFSMVTYTTLGYGDVVLEEGRRLLASFEAANGIIMFGWTTALAVAVVQRVYLKARTQQAS